MGKHTNFKLFTVFRALSFSRQLIIVKIRYNRPSPIQHSLSACLHGKTWLIFFLLVTCGCNIVGPNYSQPAPQMLSQEFYANTEISPQPTADLQTWWQNFADPTLNKLIEQAIQKNLTVQQAAERIIEARAIVNLNGGQLAPNVDFLAGYDFLKRAPNARPFAGDNIGRSFSLFSSGFDSTWEIDLFGKIARSIEAAEADLASQNFSLQDVQQTLVADVATSYLTIRLLQDQIQTVEQSIDLQRLTQTTIQERLDAGISTRLDSEQTKAFLHRTRATKAALNQQLKCEFNRLSVLVGESPAQPIREFVGTAPIPTVPLVPQAGIPADLIRRRPDVRAREAEVMAATARIGIAEADLYPSLTLLGSISLGATDPSSLFQSDSLAFSLGPSIQWNILHYGRICDNIEIHESKLRQSVLAYRETILNAVQEVEDAMAKHVGLNEQLAALAQAQEADSLAVDLSLERYQIGKANFQRVLDAQLQLLQDSRAIAEAQANYNIQLIRIYRALGGGWPGHTQPFNNMVGTSPIDQPNHDYIIANADRSAASNAPDNIKSAPPFYGSNTLVNNRPLEADLFDWDHNSNPTMASATNGQQRYQTSPSQKLAGYEKAPTIVNHSPTKPTGTSSAPAARRTNASQVRRTSFDSENSVPWPSFPIPATNR